MLRYIVVPITLLLALVVPTHAQTLEQASKLVDFLNRTTSQLTQAKTNLLQMAGGMPIEEGLQVDQMLDSITDAECYFDKLSIVATIYSVMVNNRRDQATVKKFIAIYAKHSVRAANATINDINRELAKMRSPAAITEVQKARDLVQKIRDEIQRTIPGS